MPPCTRSANTGGEPAGDGAEEVAAGAAAVALAAPAPGAASVAAASDSSGRSTAEHTADNATRPATQHVAMGPHDASKARQWMRRDGMVRSFGTAARVASAAQRRMRRGYTRTRPSVSNLNLDPAVDRLLALAFGSPEISSSPIRGGGRGCEGTTTLTRAVAGTPQ
jgi:hypothetical protein